MLTANDKQIRKPTATTVCFKQFNSLVRLFSLWIRVRVFTDTFNNILIISWRSVLLVEETGVPGENHRPAASHWQTLKITECSFKYISHEQDSNSQLQWWQALIAQVVVNPTIIWPRRSLLRFSSHNNVLKKHIWSYLFPLSAIFHLYHGDQF